MSITAPRPTLPVMDYTPIRPGDLGTPAGRHLIALDIDGTTVHHDGTMSPRVHDAIRAVVAAGHHVVIATGRSLLSTLPILRRLGLTSGYAVCSNGAVTVRLDPGEPGGYVVVDTVTFDPTAALTLLATSWPGAVYAVERVGVGYDVIAPFPEGELDGRRRVVSFEELTAEPVTRVTFSSPGSSAEEFTAFVERIGLHGVNYAVGFTAWLDITPDGVSKASGLEQVRRHLGVDPARTVAVGDQRNDVEMLGWAACGVAMGNAPEEVAAVADLVTAHVDDDGLVDVLEAVPPVR